MEEETPVFSLKPELTGRDEEIERLDNLFDNTVKGKGSTVFISGEAGIGKTRLVEELINTAEAENAKIIQGWCLADSLEPLMPFKEGLRDAGLSHFVSKNPPPKVISAYLIDISGILIAKAEREKTELDPDIFASMLTAVENFVSDSLSMMGEEHGSKLNSIRYGEFEILVQSTSEVSIAAVIEGTHSEFLINDMRDTLKNVSSEFSSWEGDMRCVDKVKPKVDWFIESRKYEGRHLVDDPKIRQENLFDNVLLGLRRISAERPVVVFIDDLQWADPSSLNMLHYLSRNTRDNGVLILGTYRPEDILELSSTIPNVDGICQKIPTDVSETYDGKTHPLKTTMQNMSREDLFETVELSRLEESTVEEFMEKTLGKIELKSGFVKEVYRESEGNPFFLLEVTKMLIEEKHLINEDGTWKIKDPEEGIHIPSKVYDVVVRRLERLIQEQRDLLECASVVGEEFESSVVGEVTGMNRVNLLKNLNKIERTHNLIHSIEKKYRFDHSKIREVLYNGINEELRQEYHRIIADTYVELYQDDIETVIEDVANHYDLAEDERAGDYLIRAGNKTKDSFGNEEAVLWYKKSLKYQLENTDLAQVYKKMGEIHSLTGDYKESIEYLERAIPNIDERETQVDLYWDIANAYERMGEYDRALEECEKGLDINKDINTSGKSRILGMMGWIYMRRNDYDNAEEVLFRALEVAESIGGGDEIGYVYSFLGNFYDNKGIYDKALDYYKKSLEIFQEIGDVIYRSKALNNIGLVNWKIGNFDKAEKCYSESLEIKENVGDKHGILVTLANLGSLHEDMGDYENALEEHKKCLEISETIGDSFSSCVARFNIGSLYKVKDEMGRAMEYFEESLALCKKINNDWIQVHNECEIAHIKANEGDFERALELIEDALNRTREMGAQAEEGLCLKVKGIIHREMEEYEEAEDELRKAENILDEVGDKKEMAKTYLEYGRLFKDRGEFGKARERLEKAKEMFGDMGMGIWVDKADEDMSTLDS